MNGDRLMLVCAVAMVLYGIFNRAGEYVGLCLVIFVVFCALASVLTALARRVSPRRDMGGFR